MLDIKFVRENPEIVKQNIRNKFQDNKLGLVDEVIELDAQSRATKQEADALRADRNKISKEIGGLMKKGLREEAEAAKKLVTEKSDYLAELEAKEADLGVAGGIGEGLIIKKGEVFKKVPENELLNALRYELENWSK